MGGKKQPDQNNRTLPEDANDWIRQFVKHLEITLADNAHELASNASLSDLSLVAIRALKVTLRDSGLDDRQILGLFGQVALESSVPTRHPKWTAELNKRRFELIDGDIQGTLTGEEQLELAGLTQMMREHVDAEVNLSIDLAKKLHSYLNDIGPAETGSGL